MNATLRRVFLASLRQRPLASLWSLLAIALGVALGLTVQLIQTAALDEFGQGLRLLSGTADLQVVGPREGFADRLYIELAQRPEVAQASPVLEIEARLPGRDLTLRILGIDAPRMARIAPSLLPVPETLADAPAGETDRLAIFRPDALFPSPAAAERLGLRVGDRLSVQVGVSERQLRIAGSLPGAGLGQVVAVMDIAGAQQLFERQGRLTRIDLRLAEGQGRAAARASLSSLLPPGVALLTPAETQAETLDLSRAYRVNLTMLAAIALLTGGFLVFSTQWLAVARRRREFAFLRALGLERGQLRRGLLAEGAALGLIGGLAGTVLAYLLTALAFRLIGGDLGAGFFRGLAPELRFEPALTLVYLLLGLAAGLAGAWWPAREAARLIPARGLKAGDEAEVYQGRPRWSAMLICLGLAVPCALLPPAGEIPVGGYLAVLLILAGAVLALPGVTPLALRRLPSGRSTLWRLARARLMAAPGQTLIAGAGIVASVALAAAMAIMVNSFRVSMDDWLTAMLPADLYLRASDAGASGDLDPAAVERILALPEIRGARPVRYLTVRPEPERRAMALIARLVQETAGLPMAAGTSHPPPAADGRRPAWLSEAAADRLRLGVGDPLELPLAGQAHGFRVAGIWRDYARQQGAIVIELADYRALTDDWRINDLGLHLAAGATPEAALREIRAILGDRTIESILPDVLRRMILTVFDRTFLVTYLMEGVAILIGLSGIAATFAALAASRRREFGILRHLGLRRRRIGTLLALEGALTASLGVAVGLLAGGAIALVLIAVVNRQSFHWSMDLHIPWIGLAVFGLTTILLAALAARLAGAQAMRGAAVLAVREDW